MSGNKKKRVRGSVLYTVVAVMSIMTVLVFAAMTLAASANRRAHNNYANNQTQYTARSVLDLVWKEISTNNKFLHQINMLTAPSKSEYKKDKNCKDIEISGIDASMGLGEIVDNKATVYCLAENKYKLELKVKMSGQENVFSAYYSTEPPEREQYDYGLKSVCDAKMPKVNLLGGACFSVRHEEGGEAGVSENATLEFPIHTNGNFKVDTKNTVNMYPRKGMFVAGNLTINNGTEFVSRPLTESLDYRELPYIHTYQNWYYGTNNDSGYLRFDSTGNTNIASADAPALVVSRAIEFTMSGAQHIYGDLYLYGKDDISIFGSGSRVCSWNDGIMNKTNRASEIDTTIPKTYTGGNIYSLGEIDVYGGSAGDKPTIGNNVVTDKLVLKNSGAHTTGAVVAREFYANEYDPLTKYYKYDFDKGLYIDPDKYLQKDPSGTDRMIYYPYLTSKQNAKTYNFAEFNYNTGKWDNTKSTYIDFKANDNFTVYDDDKSKISGPDEHYDSVDVTRITITPGLGSIHNPWVDDAPNDLQIQLKFMYKISEPGKKDEYDDIDMGGGEGYVFKQLLSLNASYDWTNKRYYVDLPKNINIKKDEPNRVVMLEFKCTNAVLLNTSIGLETLTHTNDNNKNAVRKYLKKNDKDGKLEGTSNWPMVNSGYWYYSDYKLSEFSKLDPLKEGEVKDPQKVYYDSVIPSKLMFNTSEDYEDIMVEVRFYNANTLKQICSHIYCSSKISGSSRSFECDLRHPAKYNIYSKKYERDPYGAEHEVEISSDFIMEMYIHAATQKKNDETIFYNGRLMMQGELRGVQLSADICKTVPLNDIVNKIKTHNDEKFKNNGNVIVIDDIERSVKLEKKGDKMYISSAFIRDVEEGKENTIEYSTPVEYTDYGAFLKAVTQTIIYPDSFSTLTFSDGGVVNKATVSKRKYNKIDESVEADPPIKWKWTEWPEMMTGEDRQQKRKDHGFEDLINDECIFKENDSEADYNRLCFIDDTGLYGNYSVSNLELDISETIHNKFMAHEIGTNNRVYSGLDYTLTSESELTADEIYEEQKDHHSALQKEVTDTSGTITKYVYSFKCDSAYDLVIKDCCTIKGEINHPVSIEPGTENIYIKLENVTVNKDIVVDDSDGGVVNFLIKKDSDIMIKANICNTYYKKLLDSGSKIAVPGNPVVEIGDAGEELYFVDEEKIPDIYFYGEMDDLNIKKADGSVDTDAQEKKANEIYEDDEKKQQMKKFTISGGHVVTGYILMISGKLVVPNDGSGDIVKMDYYTDEVPAKGNVMKGDYVSTYPNGTHSSDSQQTSQSAIIGACFFGRVNISSGALAVAYVNPNPTLAGLRSVMGQPRVEYYQAY